MNSSSYRNILLWILCLLAVFLACIDTGFLIYLLVKHFTTTSYSDFYRKNIKVDKAATSTLGTFGGTALVPDFKAEHALTSTPLEIASKVPSDLKVFIEGHEAGTTTSVFGPMSLGNANKILGSQVKVTTILANFTHPILLTVTLKREYTEDDEDKIDTWSTYTQTSALTDLQTILFTVPVSGYVKQPSV